MNRYQTIRDIFWVHRYQNKQISSKIRATTKATFQFVLSAIVSDQEIFELSLFMLSL